MSTLSQFFSGSISASSDITLDPLCVNRILVCQYGQVVLDKCLQGQNNVGCYFEGGHVICKSSGTSWIVSPRCSEVARCWDCREDANTVANLCTSCTGWFVPTCGQLKNPGYTCRTYWDSFSSTRYWSSTEAAATAWYVRFDTGATDRQCAKSTSLCVRAFRCVTY